MTQMTENRGSSSSSSSTMMKRGKLETLLQQSEPTFNSLATQTVADDDTKRNSSSSGETTPSSMSPLNQASPYTKSPWISSWPITSFFDENFPQNSLVGSLVREEGHVYSLAASDGVLYTGSDSKNIRVWKHMKEFSGFKSTSGFVKAIVTHENKIFTAHQDGKIRIWKVSSKDPMVHRRFGSLPKMTDLITSSMNPKNYVEVRRHRNVVKIKHFDAVSCLSLSEDQSVLYSGSWDKTIKIWRLSDSKCLESFNAHDDAVNSVAAGFDGLVFSGSADGTVKVWRRELHGSTTKHFLVKVLLEQEIAVTSVAVNASATVVYSGASDGIVNFWQGETLSHGGVLRGHRLAVLCIAAAGNLVFSGSADKGICVWRRDGGVHTCLSVLTGHSGPVKCLAVEEDRESTAENDPRWIVYSGSIDKSVKVWKVSEHAPDLEQLKLLQQWYALDTHAPSDSSPVKHSSDASPGKLSRNINKVANYHMS